MIIGITGTLGSGKEAVVECFLKKGFNHLSVSGFLTEEIKRRGLVVNRDSMVAVANELRKNNSPSYLAEKLYEKTRMNIGDYLLESLRNVGEINFLRKKGNFYLIAVDAPIETRYQRISKRKSEKDNVTYEQFLKDEEREMHPKYPHEIDLPSCIKLADFQIDNSGELSGLIQKVEEVYEEIMRRHYNNS